MNAAPQKMSSDGIATLSSVQRMCTTDNSSNTLQEHGALALTPDQRALPLRVPTLSLDGLLDAVPRVDLVKVDVQGAEARVLGGAARLIARDRPVMVIEAVPGWPSTEKVRGMLESHRYTILGLDAQGRTCPLDSPRVFVSWDWVALPS